MKQISANITGSFILNGTDLTNTLGSSSIWSGSFSTRVSDLESFSSSLDATFATDAQLAAATSSLNQYTGSNNTNISNLNSTTASLNSYTASNNTNIGNINSTTASLNSYTGSNNTNITNLNAVSASLNTFTGSAASRLLSIESTTSSLNLASGSAITRLGALEVTSGSNITRISALETASGSAITRLDALETASGSAITRLSSIESTTGSLNAASGSAITRLNALEVTSGSNITRISALEVASGSAITRLSSIESTTGSLNAASGSAITRLSALEVTSGSNITRLSSLESKTGSYATTGSNTFVDTQYVSASNNATGFTTTASLYTDGGFRVAKDAYVSGTLYLNNLTVFGTQSVAYISSSQLNIGTNIISVNTDTPSVRFGGLAVYDSGSTGLTGSILWDSQNNHWIYSNPSGSSYSGGMFISGPRTSTLGSETGTTSCMLLAGQGGDHLTSSMIYHSSTATCFHGNSFISSSGAACFAGTTTIGGNLNVGNTGLCSAITITGTSVGGFTAGYISWGNGTNTTPGLHFNSPGTNVEVTTGFNERIALSTGTGLQVYTNDGSGNYSSRMLLDRSGNVCFFNNVCAPVFGFTAAANSCIWADASYTRFVTSNSERLSIDVSGIACFKCQVCAPSFIGGTVSGTTVCTSNGIIGNNSNNLYLSSNSSAAEISFWGNQLNTRLMTITGCGCVGIGTTSNYGKITAGNVLACGYGLNTFSTDWGNSGGGSTWTGIKIGSAADTGAAGVDIRAYTYYSTTAATSMAFFTNTSSNTLTEKLRITSDGVACFNNIVCSAGLESSNSLIIRKDASVDNRYIQLCNTQTGGYRWDLVVRSTAQGCGFGILNNTTSQYALLFDVNNIASFGGTICAGGTVDGSIINSTSNAFRFSGNNALSLVSLCSQNVVKINAAGYWGVQLVGANDKGILIDNTGLVGIGTISPTRALTVSGKAQFTSTSNTNELYLADTCSSVIDNQWIGSIGNNITIGAGGFHRMNISSTGVACFACQVCAPLLEITAPNIDVYPRVNRTSTSNEAGWKLSTGGADSWYIGLRSTDNVGSYHFFSYTTSTSVVQITCRGTVLVGTTNGDVGGSVPGIALLNDGRILASICHTGALCHIFMGDRRGTSSEGSVFLMARGGFYKSSIGVLGTADSLNNGGITFSTICGNDAICERMRITSSGRIGFGSTAPCARIETTGGGYILKGGWGLFCIGYTSDGLFSTNAQPNFLSTNAYGGASPKFGSDSGLLLGYQDNGAGLYSPAYGFEVKSTDGRPVTGNVVKAIVMRDTDTGDYPFWINNNGSAYFANCIGIGTTSPSRGLTINKPNEFASLNIIKNNTGNQIVYLGTGSGGADDLGILQLSDGGTIKAQIYTGGNSYFNGGNVGINCTSPGQLLTVNGISSFKGHQQHPSGQWYKIPFYLEKGNGVGNADTRCIVVINNNDSFQELHFTIEYGSRLQGVSDQYTQTSLRSYGVNRFVGNTATVNDVYLITGGSGCNINTHAPVTVAIAGNCMSVVKVDFSTSLGNSSFVWGEIRIWSIESLAGKITIPNNNY